MANPVAELDIGIYRGDSYSNLITWKASDGRPIDLTGYTARMDVKAAPADTAKLLALADGAGLTLGGTFGTVLIEITPDEARIDTPNAVYDLELTAPGGDVTTLIHGKFTVYADVTR